MYLLYRLQQVNKSKTKQASTVEAPPQNPEWTPIMTILDNNYRSRLQSRLKSLSAPRHDGQRLERQGPGVCGEGVSSAGSVLHSHSGEAQA